MASVALDELWLHEAASNSTYITSVLSTLRETTAKPGAVRMYAGGNSRSVTSAGFSREFQVELRLADRADVDQLRRWVEAGTLLLLREPLGRRLWGVSYDLGVNELPGTSGDFADVSFTFRRTSYSEAV